MKDAATSLDRLHDIVEPPSVAWWPPAMGWYYAFAIAAVALAWMGLRMWRRWRANAYRREALRELAAATTAVEIAEVLRRTALAVTPRSKVASLTGENWTDWLDSIVAESMPQPVRVLLAGSVYAPATRDAEVAPLRVYAKTWIERHRVPRLRPQESEVG